MVAYDPNSDTRLLIARYLADVAEPLRGDIEQRSHILALDSMSQAVLTLPADEEVLQEIARYCIVNGKLEPNETFKRHVASLRSTVWARDFLTEIVGHSRIDDPAWKMTPG